MANSAQKTKITHLKKKKITTVCVFFFNLSKRNKKKKQSNRKKKATFFFKSYEKKFFLCMAERLVLFLEVFFISLKISQMIQQGIGAGRAIQQESKKLDEPKKKRIGIDEYFMRIAEVASQRSTCLKKHVGAVITLNNTIVSTGFNGSLPNLEHCEDVGCLIEHGKCIRTVHAEANAIAQAVKNRASIANSTVYITCSPCLTCFKLLVSSGARRIVFCGKLKDLLVSKFAEQAHVLLEEFTFVE